MLLVVLHQGKLILGWVFILVLSYTLSSVEDTTNIIGF